MAEIMQPVSPDLQKGIQLYGNIMNEIKLRTGAMDANVVIGELSPDRLLHEFCFLQLRMICELIALGCLVAHGDITRNTPLSNKEMAYCVVPGSSISSCGSTFEA